MMGGELRTMVGGRLVGRPCGTPVLGAACAVVKRTACVLVLPALLFGGVGCERSEPAPVSDEVERPDPSRRLEFPENAASGDAEVDFFVRSVCLSCLENDYDSFRSFWSNLEEPIKRSKFQRRWQPVEYVAVRKVEAMRHGETGEVLYAVVADFTFGTGAKDPQREVVFLVQKEGERWRLARPPKHLVERLTGDAGGVPESSS